MCAIKAKTIKRRRMKRIYEKCVVSVVCFNGKEDVLTASDQFDPTVEDMGWDPKVQ